MERMDRCKVLCGFKMAQVLPLVWAVMIYFSVYVSEGVSTDNAVDYELEEETKVSKLIEGCNRFSFELLRTLNANQTTDQESRDLFFSPYSVWSALVVTYMGARGSTRQEMSRVLGIGDDSKAETWNAYKSIHLCKSGEHDEPVNDSYNSANRIYFQKGTTLKRRIRKMLDDNIAFVDFQNRTDEARKIINTWVEKYTHMMIKDLIPPESIGKMTKMVIANAVYFKEAWLHPFERQKTARKRFTTSSGEKIFVPMMSTKGMFLHGRSEELQCSVLDLPYSDNNLGMIILLPDDRFDGLDHLVNNLTTETLGNLYESMFPREVAVSIPKFKFEDTYELSPILKEMGLGNLFNNRRVNLSGFTGLRELSLDSIRHKTMIEMNEMGTEAAASTDIFYFKSAGPSGRVSFVADHPFIFFVQDYLSNAILFLGLVNDPTEFRTN